MKYFFMRASVLKLLFLVLVCSDSSFGMPGRVLEQKGVNRVSESFRKADQTVIKGTEAQIRLPSIGELPSTPEINRSSDGQPVSDASLTECIEDLQRNLPKWEKLQKSIKPTTKSDVEIAMKTVVEGALALEKKIYEKYQTDSSLKEESADQDIDSQLSFIEAELPVENDHFDQNMIPFDYDVKTYKAIKKEVYLAKKIKDKADHSSDDLQNLQKAEQFINKITNAYHRSSDILSCEKGSNNESFVPNPYETETQILNFNETDLEGYKSTETLVLGAGKDNTPSPKTPVSASALSSCPTDDSPENLAVGTLNSLGRRKSDVSTHVNQMKGWWSNIVSPSPTSTPRGIGGEAVDLEKHCAKGSLHRLAASPTGPSLLEKKGNQESGMIPKQLEGQFKKAAWVSLCSGSQQVSNLREGISANQVQPSPVTDGFKELKTRHFNSHIKDESVSGDSGSRSSFDTNTFSDNESEFDSAVMPNSSLRSTFVRPALMFSVAVVAAIAYEIYLHSLQTKSTF